MKRKMSWFGVAALAVAILGGSAFGIWAKFQASDIPQAAMDVKPGISAEETPQKPRYLLSGYEGKLAVYMIGKKEPELVFDRYLHYLPDVDRMRLEQGIEVSDYAELLQLIEDYTS
ncbi:hypothetical protein ACS3UN_07200 [Oscillospiraceae bacterium LTW-04]|nr:hypothetical protein RBH76_03145 [Oscillospiraceae bacterium MB24-C1]